MTTLSRLLFLIACCALSACASREITSHRTRQDAKQAGVALAVSTCIANKDGTFEKDSDAAARIAESNLRAALGSDDIGVHVSTLAPSCRYRIGAPAFSSYEAYLNGAASSRFQPAARRSQSSAPPSALQSMEMPIAAMARKGYTPEEPLKRWQPNEAVRQWAAQATARYLLVVSIAGEPITRNANAGLKGTDVLYAVPFFGWAAYAQDHAGPSKKTGSIRSFSAALYDLDSLKLVNWVSTLTDEQYVATDPRAFGEEELRRFIIPVFRGYF